MVPASTELGEEAQPAETSREWHGPAKWVFIGAALLAACAASSTRIVVAPGFELYLGPLFYLLAYRSCGVRIAVPLAVLTMAASWLWWGHVFSLFYAAGHVLFVHFSRDKLNSLAVATLIYSATVGIVASAAFLRLHYDAPWVIVLLTAIRKTFNDVLLASIVDLIVSVLIIHIRSGTFRRRPTVDLARLLPATVTLIIMSSALILFVGNVRQFPAIFDDFRSDLTALTHVQLVERELAPNGTQLLRVAHPQLGPQPVLVSSDPMALRQPQMLAALGCTQTDEDQSADGPNDRNTFVYWLRACHLGLIEIERRSYHFSHSTRPIAERSYWAVLVQMVYPGLILLAALVLQLFVSRALTQSLRAWKAITEGFGKPGLAPPSSTLFSEFAQPIEAIVAANNRYAAIRQQRDQLATAMGELKQEVDLRLASDLRIDLESGRLAYIDHDMNRPPEPVALTVHPNDLIAFQNASSSRDALVEFRPVDQNRSDWLLLVARDLVSPGRWRSGWIVRLRQSKLAQQNLLHQARLVELGSMAAALSHELKQPLLSISLSAEAGRQWLSRGSPDGARVATDELGRIVEQVTRARDIMASISRYSKLGDADLELVDLAEVVRSATTFMRPMLVQEDVRTTLEVSPHSNVEVLASRIGLEQVLVNAIQNAIDAISARRADAGSALVGDITILLQRSGGRVRMLVRDNGCGLPKQTGKGVFEAFVTTKTPDKGTGLGLFISRQIIEEMGGRLELAENEGGEHGATLVVELPRSAGPEDPNEIWM